MCSIDDAPHRAVLRRILSCGAEPGATSHKHNTGHSKQRRPVQSMTSVLYVVGTSCEAGSACGRYAYHRSTAAFKMESRPLYSGQRLSAKKHATQQRAACRLCVSTQLLPTQAAYHAVRESAPLAENGSPFCTVTCRWTRQQLCSRSIVREDGHCEAGPRNAAATSDNHVSRAVLRRAS